MNRSARKRFGRAVALTASLLLASVSLSACAPAACPAMAVADDVLITTASPTHLHPLLSICESAICTPPINASSADRGRKLDATPRLALYATAVDRWRVSVLQNPDGTVDPASIGIALFDRTEPIERRTLHLTWHRAPGACSTFRTADTVHLTLP